MIEVWKRESLTPFLVGGSATFASLALDDNVVEYFDDHPHETYGKIGKYLGTGVVAVGVSAAVLAFGQRANGDRFRAASYDMGQAVVVNFLYTLAIKEAVRVRGRTAATTSPSRPATRPTRSPVPRCGPSNTDGRAPCPAISRPASWPGHGSPSRSIG